MEGSSEPWSAALGALVSRGWRFRDPDEIRALIQASHPSPSSMEFIESEFLLNLDLKSIGAKSLPDPASLKKSSYLLGPKVLQVVSVRDIYRSSSDGPFESSQRQRRLLRFLLTDGHSEVTAIEYTPIPSITEEIIPGAKVRLGNKITINSGILCLSSKDVTIMGGLVESLYEEWQMSQKYSGFSRSSLRVSEKDAGDGPPPFEKLKIGAPPQQSGPHGSLSGKFDSTEVGNYLVNRGQHSHDTKAAKVADDSKAVSLTETVEDKPSTSEARPKEVSEAAPVQNQAAAQKLLLKLSQPSHEDRQSRGRKYRGKGKQEEAPVFTLEEWERRKGSNMKPMVPGEMQDVSRDEELARQLQDQLDMEDFHGRTVHSEAEQIRMNMFSFGGAQQHRDEDKSGFRGRGRGRGRGKRRFG